MKIAPHRKPKLYTCDFCNLYFANQALVQHIGATIRIEHKSLHPYEIPSSKYLDLY